MIISLEIGHVASVNGFVSISISPVTTKLCSMAEHQALAIPFRYDDVFTSEWHDKYLWFSLHSHKPHTNQNWQDIRPLDIDLTLQVWWCCYSWITRIMFMVLSLLLKEL